MSLTFTAQVLNELKHGPGTSSEIAACMGVNWKPVAGALSNMRKHRYVKVIGTRRAGKRGFYAFIYSITNAGARRLNTCQHAE